MKIHPQFSRLCRPLPVFFVACLACGGLFAQGTSGSAKAQPKKEFPSKVPGYVLEVADGILLNDNQKQPATLARIADVLRGLYSEVNIVLAPELGEVQVKDIKLRSTELPEALEALRVASGDAFMWQNGLAQTGVPPGSVDPRTGLPVPQAPAPEASSLYILTRNDAVAAVNPRRMVEVFNLSGYLEQLGKRDEKEIAAALERIKMIVSETLNQVMQGNVQAADQPSFQFHPGANLFIVIGPPQAIEVTQKVVNALPGVAGARAYPPPAENPAANEAFRRRYGLMPPAENPAANEAIMRRYGLMPPSGSSEPPAPRPPGAVAPPQGK